jgi:hypothetical protein
MYEEFFIVEIWLVSIKKWAVSAYFSPFIKQDDAEFAAKSHHKMNRQPYRVIRVQKEEVFRCETPSFRAGDR